MNFIDLFAGAGGLSEGFIRQGFNPIAHVEMNSYASETIKTRTAYHYLIKNNHLEVYHDYLRGNITKEELYQQIPSSLLESILNKEINDETITGIFNQIDDLLLKTTGQTGKIDVIIGGPPCQAYSLVGRARDPQNKENDPRNYLYKQYVKFLVKYQPDIFVFENVPGILSAGGGSYYRDIQDLMRENGYEIQHKTLDASHYGVLQKRKRVILIGWNKELGYEYPDLKKIEKIGIVEDVLSDLPPIAPGEQSNNYFKEPTSYLKWSNIRNEQDLLTHHLTRKHNERDLNIYKIAIKLWNEEKKRLKYTDLPEHLRTHKNLKAFLDRFKVVAKDLPYSHTVVAHISKDGHHYIHPDINQSRSLSVREAARLQSFPDNYYFEGPRTAIFTQIGNAVPPLMAESIAKQVKKMLRSEVQLSINI
ncbi:MULTISPECIES: DNA cytosine methyltransferase [Paenibacillus]|uniref:DNA cytosine methyltransferase n=1 Tax=Paenibacillus TaxID=44249 RepID=UPI002DB66CCA|nr:DNA cytosine methyltransferase [Paenibacillus odorifer]MEC0134349.1 DNA cytosine methyltransferase [Paenibacillus odorifer]MEC0222925.1 DNA cytosine methyltransferase [Paenibacillus odorifer]